MNTNKLKAYAPKARIAFMDAVKKRAATLGLYEDRIADMTTDGDSAVIEGRIFTRQQGLQRSQLVRRIEALGTNNGKFVLKDGFNQFINETAFTWFNRLTAIRFMEVNEYLDHGFRVLSKAEGAQFGEGFEILSSAADVADDLGLNKEQIIDMVLDGNKEEGLYRTILLGQCHQLSEAMPFMFEKLDDATELLLPDNLTKTDSILKDLINDIPEDNWQEIEVIGWLYQFYISEHKDAVIGKVVKREDIPAATQLFTPNWIVKYLVQNSLGRQWLATYPDSELKEKMEYYITPAEQSDDVIEQLKAITPTCIDPEEIKVLDPACGSGHILVEVYEVLREIYLERGYRQREIPELILTKNIYGLDIDDRAAQMAAFAVLMKAREDDKRIFTRDIKLNIHSIQSTENLNINQLWTDLDFDGNKQTGSMGDLFSEPQLDLAEPSTENKVYLDLLRYLKEQFIDAKNLGSLVEIDSQYLEPLTALQEKLAEKELGNEPTAKEAAQTLLPIVEQAIVLATKYDVAVANPPYMGSKGMNATLKDFAKKSYVNSKSDLFAMFIERGFKWLSPNGFNSMVTMQSWMFLSSFEKMRESILRNSTIETMVHMGNGVMKIAFGTNATVFQNRHTSCYKGSFSYCENGDINELGVPKEFPLQNRRLKTATSEDFKKIPGSPIAYWCSQNFKDSFRSKALSEVFTPLAGITTGCNDKYLRYWFEISQDKFITNLENGDLPEKNCFVPHMKGGNFRRWYGNKEHCLAYSSTSLKMMEQEKGFRPDGIKKFFEPMISWSYIGSSDFSARFVDGGASFDTTGSCGFSTTHLKQALGLLNSVPVQKMLDVLNPTMTYLPRDIKALPLTEVNTNIVDECIEISQADWNSQEVSWNFEHNLKKRSMLLNQYLTDIAEYWFKQSERLQSLEQENNSNILKSFNLNEEIEPTVNIKDISLVNNPLFTYQTAKEPNRSYKCSLIMNFVSLSIGCMMGRYSLDREGLVYAHSGNNAFKDLVEEGAYQTFPADDDGIVPLADEEWLFDDDATTRFREFVKTAWGEEHLQENLDFVAESLCLDAIKAKKGESSIDTIRRYFSTQFYKDHLKTYKKRPIYWLFSSGKAKAFECLVYLHRYNEGTLSRMRTEYVTPLMGKLESRKNILEDSKATASGAELRSIDRELKTIEKKQAELVIFDEELKHLAEMKISLDLDDGVKVNYGKFGNLLADVKAIHGKKPEAIK